MKFKLVMVLIAAGALLSAGPALADYPDDCLGMGVVSGAGCEHTEAYEGCCDDLGRVIWCENGDTYCIDCAGLNPSCGWQGDFYDCGTDGSPEPSGTFPLECVSCEPACVPGTKCVGGECVPCEPECEGKNCGSDNCGGDCGECSGGQTCSGGLCQVVGCEALPSAGCGGCPCEACVCEMDPFCCDNTWDGICAGECLEQCGGCLPLENCGDGDCDTTKAKVAPTALTIVRVKARMSVWPTIAVLPIARAKSVATTAVAVSARLAWTARFVLAPTAAPPTATAKNVAMTVAAATVRFANSAPA